MRLIDADALKKEFTEGAFTTRGVREIIDYAPTVDGRPKGKWIKHISSLECSECKVKFFCGDEDENVQDYDPCNELNFNFCPNCGADLREVVNE